MIHRRSFLLAAVVLCSTGAAHAQWVVGHQPEVPLDGNGQSWIVQATLNGSVRGRFLLDTGASYCVLGPTAARRLSLPPTGSRVTLRTANGTVQAPIVQITSVDVGGHRARDIQAVVHDAVAAPLDGIIGLSFLNNFTYAVDPRRKMLTLR